MFWPFYKYADRGHWLIDWKFVCDEYDVTPLWFWDWN